MGIVVLDYSEEFSCLLMVADRFSQWPKVIPLADMAASTVAQAFSNDTASGLTN